MKRLLNVITASYIAFALLVAHSALAPSQEAPARDADSGSVVVEAGPALCDYQRLVDDYPEPYEPKPVEPDPADIKPKTNKSCYTVVVWTADWCGPCQRWKRIELPALLKAGYKVTVKDYDTDDPPKSVKSVPTIMLYLKGNIIQSKTYWRANAIDKYVDNHLSLKG